MALKSYEGDSAGRIAVVPLGSENVVAAYAFATEILNYHRVSDATLARARTLFGDRGVIEIGAIIGHYHSGAIALGLAEITLPDGSKTCLPP